MIEKGVAGETIYNRIKSRLKGQEGRIVAIDVKSGDFFLGNNVVEASKAGQEKYPKREFYFKRVGSKTAFVIRTLLDPVNRIIDISPAEKAKQTALQ